MKKKEKVIKEPIPETKAPISRGHKQRGAGTVITAKAPVITQDGILLKIHERLPTQLLTEYCQRDKRPNPQYLQKSPEFTYEVFLPDAKNSKFDLRFKPNQSFESDKVAKDFAALLALFHFQKNIPLENKLPDPYRTTWLQMLDSAKQDLKKTIQKSSSAKEVISSPIQNPDPPTNAEAQIQSPAPPPSPPSIIIDPSTADWLCENCSNQNFALLLSGAMRTKCFKCQTPKYSSVTLLASSNSSSSTKETKSSLSSSSLSLKAPPRAASNLSNQLQNTDHQREKEELLRRTALNREASYLEGLALANKPFPILMSLRLRSALNSLLRPTPASTSTSLSPSSSQTLVPSTVISDMLEFGFFRTNDSDPHPSTPPSTLSLPDQRRALQSVLGFLSRNGFSDQIVSQALLSLLTDPSPLIQTSPQTLERVLKNYCLEYVCLHESETALPAQYSAIDSEKLSISVLTPSSRPPILNLSPSPSIEDEVESPDTVSSSPSTPSETRDSVKSTRNRRKAPSFWHRQPSLPRPQPVIDSSISEARQRLPAFSKREEFMDLVSRHRGLIVTGETGCGKTTQIPQYLLSLSPTSKVIVCQPRRLAAIGVASRIAQEMGCELGSDVGYMVKGESRASPDTRICLMTYGVLLRRMVSDPSLDAVDYIVLDEIHERGLDSDFSFVLLKRSLQSRPALRLILMSATLSTEKFSTYLSSLMTDSLDPSAPAPVPVPVPVLFIPGFTFEITEYYKNQFESSVREISSSLLNEREKSSETDLDDPSGNEDEEAELEAEISLQSSSSSRIGGFLRRGEIDFDLLVRLLLCLIVGGKGSLRQASGTILVFLPGVPEIHRLLRLLEETADRLPEMKRKMISLPLHGNLSPSEQAQVFVPAGGRKIRVVCSTNVAEASVTIPDVSVVVDTCRVKETEFDVEKQMSGLKSKFASQDSLRQRRGRAGRVSEGRCFRLITDHVFGRLPLHSIPEMLRAPLDSLVLQVRAMGIEGEMHALLSQAPDPPSLEAVLAAEQFLQQLQALRSDGSLTPLGNHMSRLPCDPRVARLLVYGSLLGCCYHMSLVACFLVCRSPFLSTSSGKSEIVDVKEQLFVRFRERCRSSRPSPPQPIPKSDHIIMVEAFLAWEKSTNKKMSTIRSFFVFFLESFSSTRFCQDNLLSHDRLAEIRANQLDFLRSLTSLGLLGSVEDGLNLNSPHNRFSADPKVLSSAICAGLYPSVSKILRPPKKFDEVLGGGMERKVKTSDLSFYLPSLKSQYRELQLGNDSESLEPSSSPDTDTTGMHRVLIDSASLNSRNAQFRFNNYLVFGEARMVSSSSSSSLSKALISDVTEVSPYPLLFFGGALKSDLATGTLSVDDWIRFSGPGKLVALVRALRKQLDSLLESKLHDSSLDLVSSPLLSLVCEIISKDGLDE